jgi:hypothetical protein
VQSAYIGRLATGCKRFVSSRIWSVPSALRRRMGREAPEPNRSRERPGKPHTEQCNAAAALRLASGACHESKSCCRGLGRPRITSRPDRRARTGRIQSRCSFAFLRSTFHRRPPFSLRDQWAESVHRHADGLQSPGGIHGFLRDQHRAVACPSTVVNKVVQAVIALSSSRMAAGKIADIPCFAAPPGDAHRARGSRSHLLSCKFSATLTTK